VLSDDPNSAGKFSGRFGRMASGLEDIAHPYYLTDYDVISPTWYPPVADCRESGRTFLMLMNYYAGSRYLHSVANFWRVLGFRRRNAAGDAAAVRRIAEADIDRRCIAGAPHRSLPRRNRQTG
jgi:hypothetical protein